MSPCSLLSCCWSSTPSRFPPIKRPSNKLALWENLKTISECFEGVLSAMCDVLCGTCVVVCEVCVKCMVLYMCRSV